MTAMTAATLRADDGHDTWERAFALLPAFHGEEDAPIQPDTSAIDVPPDAVAPGVASRIWSKLVCFFSRHATTTDYALKEYWFRMC